MSVAALFTFAVAACSSSSSTSGPTTSSEAASRQTMADNAVLTTEDFPADWTSQPVGEGTSNYSQGLVDDLSRCIGTPVGILGNPPSDAANADSPIFKSPDRGTTVAETVGAWSEPKLQALFNQMARPNAPDCVGAMFRGFLQQLKNDPDLPPDFSVGAPKAEHMHLAPANGEAIEIQVEAPITASGGHAVGYSDFLFLRSGELAAVVTVTGPSAPSKAVVAQYARKALDRMRTPAG